MSPLPAKYSEFNYAQRVRKTPPRASVHRRRARHGVVLRACRYDMRYMLRKARCVIRARDGEDAERQRAVNAGDRARYGRYVDRAYASLMMLHAVAAYVSQARWCAPLKDHADG